MIIGIGGKMGTGKTTLANYLVGLVGGHRASFADALRDEVEALFGVPMETLRSREGKNTPVTVRGEIMTVRELLQWWGSERRRQDPSYWIRKAIDHANRSMNDYVVFDDLRYWNEAEAIRATNGVLIRLNPFPEWQSGPGAEHASETELDTYDLWDAEYTPAFGDLESVALDVAGL